MSENEIHKATKKFIASLMCGHKVGGSFYDWTEGLSDVLKKRPEFTYEQIDWICYMIGEWYVFWQDKIADYETETHRLGFAKEALKELLFTIETDKGDSNE